MNTCIIAIINIDISIKMFKISKSEFYYVVRNPNKTRKYIHTYNIDTYMYTCIHTYIQYIHTSNTIQRTYIHTYIHTSMSVARI